MPYANAHVKVTLIGSSFNGAEEWSTGFRMGAEDTGSGNFDVAQDWLDALLPLWQTFFTSQDAYINGYWKTTQIKAAVILPDGKTDIDTVKTANYGTPISGAGIDKAFPAQIALVAQLAAASPVGLGAKGRMYLPGVGHVLQGQGGIASADAQKVANALRTFLDGAESAVNSPGYVINASKGRPGVPFTAPVNRRVTQVRVGTIYDTQRRRRNGLTEVYSTAALAN